MTNKEQQNRPPMWEPPRRHASVSGKEHYSAFQEWQYNHFQTDYEGFMWSLKQR